MNKKEIKSKEHFHAAKTKVSRIHEISKTRNKSKRSLKLRAIKGAIQISKKKNNELMFWNNQFNWILLFIQHRQCR